MIDNSTFLQFEEMNDKNFFDLKDIVKSLDNNNENLDKNNIDSDNNSDVDSKDLNDHNTNNDSKSKMKSDYNIKELTTFIG
ncbi:hypothetical protein RhiirA5_433889 [Rhizophagus irregularis]|uniref:Uncharacterized protein n=1 Tax=Rhizophagus irregularis TaxID=588596 RepID=A0A2N0NR00_9GLOM|nr:hypothetical protein RhiirA5_433889 [Rhizophagus irregularis]